MKKEIKPWCLFQTDEDNYYFYDQDLKQTHLCHPLLFHILSLYGEGISPATWLEGINGNQFHIEGIGDFSKSEAEYYYQKFLHLKENGFFKEIDQGERISAELSPQAVEQTMANINQVTLEVTERCNLNCTYCGYGHFYGDYGERENMDLEPQFAHNLLDYLAKYWNSPLNQSHNRNIYFSFYGGEPLLNMDFIKETIAYARDLDLKHNYFTFNMTTNGILLHKYMDYLVENEVNLLISLDGNEHNNAYRVFKNGEPAFQVIMDNVEKLRSKYPQYFKDHVQFNAVLHNKNSVSEIYHYIREKFDKLPSIGSLNSTGILESKKKEFWETYVNIDQSLYEKEDYSFVEKDMFVKLPTISDLAIFLFEANHFCYENYNDLIFSKKKQKRIPTGTCLPFSKKIFMTVKGKLLPCERVGHQFELGRVHHHAVNLDFAAIAEQYNGYFNKMKRLCSLCYRAEVCKQCVLNLDTIEDEHPQCPGFLTDKHYGKDIQAFMSRFEKEPELYSRILSEVKFE